MAITNLDIKNAVNSGKYSQPELLNLARKYGIPTSRVDQALEWKPGTASGYARSISGLDTTGKIQQAVQSGNINPFEAFNLAYGIGAPKTSDPIYDYANKSLKDLFNPDYNYRSDYKDFGFGQGAGILSQLMGGYIDPEQAFANAFQANRIFRGTGNNGPPQEWIPGIGWSSVNLGESGSAFPNATGYNPTTGLPIYDLSDPRFFDRMVRASGMESLMGYNTAPVFNRSPNINNTNGVGTGFPGNGLNGNSGGSGGNNTNDPRDFLNDPSYEFRRDEALRAIEQSRAAQGRLNSGATGRELERYASNLASQEWQNEFARKFGLSQQGLQALQIMLGAIPGQIGVGGFPTIGGIPFSSSGAGNNVNLGAFAQLINGAANSFGDAGAARALGGLGSSNAWLNSFGSISDIFQNWWAGRNTPNAPIGGDTPFF